MSNLGTVYEIDTKRGVKNKYPVVYSNKTLYYCKQYGCDELERFYKNRCISSEKYYSILEKNKDFYGTIFVDSDDDVQILEIPKETILKIEIEDLEKKLAIQENALNYYKKEIQRAQKHIEGLALQIQETKKLISKHEEKLLNLKKGNNFNG